MVFRIDIADMYLRDQRVYEWLQSQSNGNPIQVSSKTIAKEFDCHENTAQAILNRLKSTEHIEVVAQSYRGGHVYQVKSGQNRTCA